MKIAPATLDELVELAALEREVFRRDNYPTFFFRQAHDLWPTWLLVAKSDSDKLLGYVLGAPAHTPGEAWILSAASLPTARGGGIGSDLLGALLQEFREDSIQTVWLTVHPQNRAVHLYERNGFERVSEHANYFGPKEPRLRLRLNLTA